MRENIPDSIHTGQQAYHLSTTTVAATAAVFLTIGILISLTWYEPGSFIARGDNYPKVSSVSVFLHSFYLWSDEHFGYYNPASTVIYHWALWAVLEIVFGAALGQSIFYGLMMGGSMLFVYLLTMKLFQSKLAAAVAALFYVFNFFYVNLSIAQTISYAMFFTPLLVLLSVNIIEKMRIENSNYRRETFAFIVALSVAIPVLYVNPGALYATIITVTLFWSFYLLMYKRVRRQVVTKFPVFFGVSVLLLGWFFYASYTYIASANTSLEFVTEADWQWTHERFTLQNILRLDGTWSWYSYRLSSYTEFYENPFLLFASYVPFALSISAIIFAGLYYYQNHRQNNNHDHHNNNNSYNRWHLYHVLFFFVTMGGIILFLVNTTGPFGEFVYQVLPLSFLFREPYSKLMPPLILFMSLLIAFSLKVIYSKILAYPALSSGRRVLWKKAAVVVPIVLLLLSNGSQLIGKERLTSQIIPNYSDTFDVYVSTPDYWNEAAEWLNQKPGDWKVLFLPNNDYYQMPYDWNYYGVDYLSYYIDKPVVMQQYNYLIPQETVDSIGLIYQSIRIGDTNTFQRLLETHGVQYIIQRNDVMHDFSGRQIINPERIENFLASQQEIVKVNQFGKLDVYEFRASHAVILSPNALDDGESVIDLDTFVGWYPNLPAMQQIEIQNFTNSRVMTAYLHERPSVWATVNSPLLLANYYSTYAWELDIGGTNVHRLHIKIAEYDESQQFIDSKTVMNIGSSGSNSSSGGDSNGVDDDDDGASINSQHIDITYKPTSTQVAFIQLQIWHGYETDKAFPNIIRISDVTLTERGPSILLSDMDNAVYLEEEPSKLNPTLYRFALNSNSSGLLIFNQAYDPQWQARIGTQTIPSVPVFGIFNGFPIDSNNGNYYDSVFVEYEPQLLFSLLVVTSIIATIGCISIMIRPQIIDLLVSIVVRNTRSWMQRGKDATTGIYRWIKMMIRELLSYARK